MKKLVFALFLLLSLTSYAQECDINPYEALEFLGKEATVCGTINQVYTPKYTKGNPTYLNMGEKFPNHSFTIVIWGDAKKNITYNFEDLVGKKVAVTGIVKEYNDKPQIEVKVDEQLIEF